MYQLSPTDLISGVIEVCVTKLRPDLPGTLSVGFRPEPSIPFTGSYQFVLDFDHSDCLRRTINNGQGVEFYNNSADGSAWDIKITRVT